MRAHGMSRLDAAMSSGLCIQAENQWGWQSKISKKVQGGDFFEILGWELSVREGFGGSFSYE